MKLLRAALIAGLVAGCRATEPDQPAAVPKGDRHFGIHVTAAADNDYVRAYQAARAAGVDWTAFAINWTAVETPTGWDTSTLETADAFFGAQGLPLFFTILSPINTTVPEVPVALRGLPYDDPRMIAGFNRLLDTIRVHTPHLRIEVLILGNEIDATLGSDPAAWARYQAFFEATRAKAKQLWGPALAVAPTITRDGLSTPGVGAAIDRLIAAADVASITYYPLTSDVTMRAPATAGPDIDQVVARIAAKPIYFQEVGFSTSSANGSSDEWQRQFAEEVFKAWDRHADRIKYFGWLWLTDLSAQQTDELVRYYGFQGSAPAQRFGEYLRTLGLRNHDGSAKPAYTAVTSLLRVRGWTNP